MSYPLAAEAAAHGGSDGTEGESLHSDSDEEEEEGSKGDDDDEMEEDEPQQAWNAAGLAPCTTQVLVDGHKKLPGGCTSKFKDSQNLCPQGKCHFEKFHVEYVV